MGVLRDYKIFRASIYSANRAIIFARAQFSCDDLAIWLVRSAIHNTAVHQLEPKWRPLHDLVYCKDLGRCGIQPWMLQHSRLSSAGKRL